jgi:hypothetical protein
MREGCRLIGYSGSFHTQSNWVRIREVVGRLALPHLRLSPPGARFHMAPTPTTGAAVPAPRYRVDGECRDRLMCNVAASRTEGGDARPAATATQAATAGTGCTAGAGSIAGSGSTRARSSSALSWPAGRRPERKEARTRCSARLRRWTTGAGFRPISWCFFLPPHAPAKQRAASNVGRR